ncbi:hypothetical protein A6V25_27035 [Nostoc sp. ATCC 53789]|nr:hypothetical protein A6V25_27035 [Nostoc sp. ATCC 53789]
MCGGDKESGKGKSLLIPLPLYNFPSRWLVPLPLTFFLKAYPWYFTNSLLIMITFSLYPVEGKDVKKITIN